MTFTSNNCENIVTPINGVNIDTNFVDFSYTQLYAMAEFFEEQANMCRSRAVYFESRTVSTSKIHKELKYYREELPRFVRRYLRQGYNLDEAIKKASEVSEIPADTVEIYWIYFTRAKRAAEKKRRNDLILYLAEYGFCNQAIGKRVKMHEKSVSRVISQNAPSDFVRGRNSFKFKAQQYRHKEQEYVHFDLSKVNKIPTDKVKDRELQAVVL